MLRVGLSCCSAKRGGVTAPPNPNSEALASKTYLGAKPRTEVSIHSLSGLA
jgi:hypothetical protein